MNDLIGQDVYVNFVAYGNADTIDVDGGYEFKCQHGEDECYGNFVQACTEAHAPDYDTGLRWHVRHVLLKPRLFNIELES